MNYEILLKELAEKFPDLSFELSDVQRDKQTFQPFRMLAFGEAHTIRLQEDLFSDLQYAAFTDGLKPLFDSYQDQKKFDPTEEYIAIMVQAVEDALYKHAQGGGHE